MGGDLYQAAVDGWYEEGVKFGWRYGVDGFSSDTGHFTQVRKTFPIAHYIYHKNLCFTILSKQVIWASATKVGCAMAEGSQWTYVVCNYDAGNMMVGYIIVFAFQIPFI